MRVLFLCLISVNFLLLLSGCSENESVLLNKIALYEVREGNSKQIYAGHVGDETMTLVAEIANDERYLISPSGAHVVVYYGQELKTINIHSQQVDVIVENVIWPKSFAENIRHKFVSWSPDGNRLAILTGGPNSGNAFHSATELLLIDIPTKSLIDTYKNETWINDVVWSPDSKSVAFPEISIPCKDGEACSIPDAGVLLTILHSPEGKVFERVSSTSVGEWVDPLFWRTISICDLGWSGSGKFVSYKQDCELNVISRDLNTYVMNSSWEKPVPLLPFQNADVRYTHALWGRDDQILSFSRDYIFGEVIETKSNLTLYSVDVDSDIPRTLVDESLDHFQFKSPVQIDFSSFTTPYYGIGQLEDNSVVLVSFDRDIVEAKTLEMVQFSTYGLWIEDGYLTQSQDKLIFIGIESGQIKTVLEDIPKDYRLIGWADASNSKE